MNDNNVAALDKSTLSSKSNNAIETQANMLATSILMPKPQIKKAFYAHRCNDEKYTVTKLAEIFKVSKQAMEIRLKNHKLI